VVKLGSVTVLFLLVCFLPVSADIGGELSRVNALTDVRIIAAPGADPFVGNIVLRDGRIVAVGPDVEPPSDARVHVLTGFSVYAGLIEPYLSLRTEKQADPGKDAAAGAARANHPASSHPNPAVRAEIRAVEALPIPEKLRREMREAGYTTALAAPGSGVFRGSASLVGLVDDDPATHVLLADASQVFAFEVGSWGDTSYPSSLMGTIALARQTFYDTDWYDEVDALWREDPTGRARPRENLSLRALRPVLRERHPVFFESEDLPMAGRAFALAEEFALNPVIVSGASDEYRRIEWIGRKLEDANASLVVSVNFPPPPYWEEDDERAEIELESLVHWERAHTNPGELESAGISFSITTQGLAKRKQIHERMQTAIRHGLSGEAALAALTTEPARLFGLDDQLGTIEAGKLANLVVTTGDLFERDTRIVEVWIDGIRHGDEPRSARAEDVEGTWKFMIGAAADTIGFKASFEQSDGRLVGVVPATEETEEDAPSDTLRGVNLTRGTLTFVVPRATTGTVDLSVSGKASWGLFIGDVSAPGLHQAITGRKLSAESDVEEDSLLSEGAPPWPPVVENDDPPTVHIKNGTLWTCGPEGKLADGDVILDGGRIAAIGSDLESPGGATVVDASGLHITPGIVDCHSHSAITGDVNEGTRSSSAMVRIADVVNPRSAATYRELAGGLTVQNLLHGSANSIGGQNAVIKLRWGRPAEDLFFGAPQGIKCALGENVKQSNWGEKYVHRYPQTRMGVEQVFRDRFSAALDYRKAHADWKRTGEGLPPKHDLELEALLEIIDGTRLIHCHAYRQDEMLMLMRVMKEFGVRVATFQHALEAYKIADELAAHGTGASAFSDWWAYKFEVYDAIPYAGAIMWDRGVVVSYNSDSSELSRRLNLEAAKAVKYGGVPETEALKFITLNAAIQLGIDDRVGSLEIGKDADVAVWSDHPLSDAAICLETWVDGIRRFSRDEDLAARAAAEELREALLDKAERARADAGAPEKFRATFGRPRQGADERGCCEVIQGVCVEETDAAAEER